MPAVTVSNQAANTATLTNQEHSEADLLVSEADFLVSEAAGKVATPYGITNQAANTATLTNQAEN